MSISPLEALKIIEPYPSEWMHAIEVGPAVGNVRNNNPTLIKAVEKKDVKPDLPKRPIQGTLF